MSEENKFYSTESIAKTSKKGYYQEKIYFVLNYLRNLHNPKVRILDVACNDGKLTSLYGKHGKVLGIDVNEKAIELCKEKGIDCRQIDIRKMPKKFDNYFDVVIAGDIIEHIFDTDNFLDNIYRTLKKNGVLLLTTPNLASLGRRLMLFLGINPFIEYSVKLPNVDYNVGHIRYFTQSNLVKQLQFHNFNKITTIGDKINLSSSISIPHFISKYFPGLCRNLMVSCIKK